jgi:hypothetical protein
LLERQALSQIMPAFDVVKDMPLSLRLGAILPSVHQLPLEHAKETFGGGVVGTSAE